MLVSFLSSFYDLKTCCNDTLMCAGLPAQHVAKCQANATDPLAPAQILPVPVNDYAHGVVEQYEKSLGQVAVLIGARVRIECCDPGTPQA